MEIGTRGVLYYDTNESPAVTREYGQTEIHLTNTIGVVQFPKDMAISGNYKLQTPLTAEVKIENNKYVVVDYAVDEYGIGNSLMEAQQDLLDSLVDYLVSLQKREHRLADRELHNLQLLRSMIANG
jgi:hypothetical protein